MPLSLGSHCISGALCGRTGIGNMSGTELRIHTEVVFGGFPAGFHSHTPSVRQTGHVVRGSVTAEVCCGSVDVPHYDKKGGKCAATYIYGMCGG